MQPFPPCQFFNIFTPLLPSESFGIGHKTSVGKHARGPKLSVPPRVHATLSYLGLNPGPVSQLAMGS